MSKKGCLLFSTIFFFIIVILCICCIATIALVASSADNSINIQERELISTSSKEKIAVIDIEGVIASTENNLGTDDMDMVDVIMQKLEKAQKDTDVKGIILRLDTPGGTVFDSDKISKKVQEVTKDKPVVALIESSATSGGYYIAVSADKIIASDTSVTGSIGVITQIVDLDGLYNKLGVNVITITNTKGTIKAFDHLDDPESEQYKVLVSVLDDNYNSFVNMVANGRNMEKEEVEKLADGRIFSGKKAKELNLIDELGGFETAVDEIEKLSNTKDATVILYYTELSPFSDFPSMLLSKINPFESYFDKVNTEPGIYHYYLPSNVGNN